MTAIQEKLIDKVRKLINKAEGSDNQAEADAFMLKANQILLEHNLCMSQIDTEDDNSNGIVEKKKAVAFGEIVAEGGQWEHLLMGVLCAHNMCDSIIHTKRNVHGGLMSVIGTADNVEIVLYLYEVATRTIRKLSKEAYKSVREETLAAWFGEMTEKELLKAGHLPNRMPWIRNYLKGAALGLNDKLQLQKVTLEKESNVASSGQFALMIIGNKEAIEKYKEEEYSDLGKSRAVKIVDKSAYIKGKEDGFNINLNKGLGGQKQEPSKQIS